MNTAMLASSTIRNESFAGSSTGQPQNFKKWRELYWKAWVSSSPFEWLQPMSS